MTIIRPAAIPDHPAIQKVVRDAYLEFSFGFEPEGYNRDLFQIQSHYAAPNAFWVAESEGQIIGCIGIELFPTHPGELGQLQKVGGQIRVAGADCELVRLYLDKKARGRGIGRQLAETCIAYARESNCKAMEIWSDKVLASAHKLYQSLGAEILGERLCPPPDETPEWGMLIRLR